MKGMLLVLCCVGLALSQSFSDGGNPQATGVPPPPTTTFPGQTFPSTQPTSQTTSGQTTAAPQQPTCPGTGPTEINFDFKGLLAGAQGGECNCAQKQQCDQCAYGIFGYPCIADPCDQCLCGGGQAVPPGSACLPCTAGGQCSDGVTQSTCLNGQRGPCEPNMQIYRKTIFLGNAPIVPVTAFFAEVEFTFQANWCHYQVTWSSSSPANQVNLFAMQYQFGTAQGANDTAAQCFQGLRYKVVNGANVNYNIVTNSLQYDARFSTNGVLGLLYTASGSSFGSSNSATDFRSPLYRCPAGITAANLPVSFKLVVNGANIQLPALNNVLDNTTDPNPFNWGSHWIMLPDRGVCVGDSSLAQQNDGSWILYDQSNPSCFPTPCYANAGPPVFANPPSQFKRDELPVEHVAREVSGEALWGPQFGL